MNTRDFGSIVTLLALAGCGAAEPAPVAAPATPVVTPATPSIAPAPPPAARPPWASAYPATRVEDVKDTMFGTEVRDPYRWLEDVKSPEVQAWMKAEDDLARSKLTKLPGRDAIAARLRELFYVDTESAPFHVGSRWFYTRRLATQEKNVVYYRTTKDGPDHVLLDPNAWSTDGSVSLLDWSVSWDGQKVAYTVSKNHADEATMHVMDVATAKESKIDVIPGCKYAHASWMPKAAGFYYIRVPVDPAIHDDERPGYAELRYHALGSDPSSDKLVHEKTGDSRTFLDGYVSKDGRWLIADIAHGWNTTDVYLRDLHSKKTEWTTVVAGTDAQYGAFVHKGKLIVRTNEGAPHWRIFSADATKPDRASWKEIVAERADATLDGLGITGGALSLAYLKDVSSRLEIHDLDGKLLRSVELPSIGTSSTLLGDEDEDDAFYTFTSFTQPPTIYETSVKKGGQKLWFAPKVPVDSSQYQVEQIFFTSKDGTRVPAFVVAKKGFVKDGSAPAIIDGYGGFQVSLTPEFTKTIFPWLDRGGIYVEPNLRGGGEYGEGWHRAGMLHEKQHVFDDVAAAAEYIQREKYTSVDRTVIRGRSNGGLLVGAAITEHPELYRVAICGVPLLDMIRYPLFGSGSTWMEEYGSPKVEADFRALFAYSPYHHVTEGTKYPSVLLESADSDDRVDPMHARKFAAALQAASSGGPVLLRIERHSGHGGADMLRAWVDLYADEYAFIFAELGKTGGSF